MRKYYLSQCGLGLAAVLGTVVGCSSSAAENSDSAGVSRDATSGSTTTDGLTHGASDETAGTSTGTTGDSGLASPSLDADSGESSDPSDPNDPNDPNDSAGGAGGAVEAGVPARVPSPQGHTPPSGELTAGIFDDNLSFPFFKDYLKSQQQNQTLGTLAFTLSDHEAAHQVALDSQVAHQLLDISLVIDTTGSMGDELEYLKTEFDALSQTIAKSYPNSEQHWSLVVYRDVGDEYLTQNKDFTDDLPAFRKYLSAQTFGGGGDFPEAPDAGLMAANQLHWRSDKDVAKLIFWVADAPHHAEKAVAFAQAVTAAQSQGIHIYPVASSGVDAFTEFTMRQTAQLTSGRYLFLTDDSGLGNSHMVPTLPCYYVSTLSDAIIRSVNTEMTGERTKISSKEIVRFSGGLNTEGNCYVGDGFQATPF